MALKKLVVGFVAIALSAFFSGSRAENDIDPKLMKKALELHRKAIVIDTHVDTPLLMAGQGMDISRRSAIGEVDLARMKEGGLDAVFLAVFVSNEYDTLHPSKIALETIDVIHEQIGECPYLAELALSTQDIRRVHEAGRRAVLIGMENGGPVEGSLGLLRDFYRLGVRYVTLTHNSSNHICDSSTDEPRWGGLSPFGIEMVAEMNRLGMIIDVSHISDDAFFDVLEHSRAPVIASHSAVREICDVPRNLSDEMLERLSEKGGVIQVVFYSGFLSREFWDKALSIEEELRPEFDRIKKEAGGKNDAYYARAMPLWRENQPEAPEISILIDHIDHIVEVAGIDHVGLGSDYDGAGSFPKGLEDASGYPLITYHLLERGYSPEDVLKILGGNTMRVFEEVERVASPGVEDYHEKALKAYRDQDYESFLGWSEKLVEAGPDEYLFRYYRAKACALAGDAEKALEDIEFLVEADYDLIHFIPDDPVYSGIRDEPAFKGLAESIRARAVPIVTSDGAFTIPEKDLIPESIAYDPVGKDFYLGSLHKCKIVRYGSDGALTDFTAPMQDGLLPVVGIKVDAKRRHLWAASGYGYDKRADLPEESFGTTGVFKYDLETGRLIKKYMIPSEGRFLNDLVISSGGDVYITDSVVPAIFVIRAAADTLEKIIDLPREGNGLDFNGDETGLFVAGSGIGFLDLETGEFRELTHPSRFYPCGDGLYYYEGSLISICLDKVSRFYLDARQEGIEACSILDAYHPEYNAPTTGVLVGDTFYYIANSQLGEYDKEGMLLPLSELEDPIILKIELAE